MSVAAPRPGLGPVLLTVFLDLLGFGLVIPLLSFFAQERGASPWEVTALLASYSVAQFIGAPLWGALSDRVGRRPVLLLSTAATALFLALFALATSLPALFLFRTLHGLAAANIPTAQAYVADVTEGADRARGMGLIGAAFGVGFTVGPMVGGLLSVWGLAAPLLVAAGLSAINAVWVWARLPESRPPGARPASTARPRRMAALRAALGHPVVGLAVGLTFAAGFAFSMLEATFSLVAEHVWGMGAQQVGGLFGLIGAIGIVVQGGLIGRLVRAFGEPPLVVVGFASTAAGMAVLGTVPAGAGVWSGCGLVAIGSSLSNPSLTSLISRSTGASEQGAVLGAAQSLGALARATAPGIAGWLYTAWQPTGALLTGAVLMGASAVFAAPATLRARGTLGTAP